MNIVCFLTFIRGWAVSTTTSACGWTAILVMVTAAHSPSAPPLAALSFPETKNSLWTRWKCGLWDYQNSQRRCVSYLNQVIKTSAVFQADTVTGSSDPSQEDDELKLHFQHCGHKKYKQKCHALPTHFHLITV